MIIRPTLHILLHFLIPAGISYSVFRNRFLSTWLLMISTMVIDFDHFLANPIYNPDRCSINFHPLHTYWALAGYMLLVVFPKTRILGIGLLVHYVLDASDCIWMLYF